MVYFVGENNNNNLPSSPDDLNIEIEIDSLIKFILGYEKCFKTLHKNNAVLFFMESVTNSNYEYLTIICQVCTL